LLFTDGFCTSDSRGLIIKDRKRKTPAREIISIAGFITAPPGKTFLSALQKVRVLRAMVIRQLEARYKPRMRSRKIYVKKILGDVKPIQKRPLSANRNARLSVSWGDFYSLKPEGKKVS
jgi:hypothetical protein